MPEAESNKAGKNILIVDDDSSIRRMLGDFVSIQGYSHRDAASAEEALACLAGAPPDLILLDISMPGRSGLELLEDIRQGLGIRQVPIILVSALQDSRTVIQGLRLGANDYITKPFDPAVLLARMENQLETAARMAKLEEKTDELSRLASYDQLTGVFNRRAFFDMLENEIARSKRYGHELSLLMVDLDHFKRVNDTYGHSAGDEILVQFAKRALASLRSEDVLARYGGEEFCVILPETGLGSASTTAERIRHSMHDLPFDITAGAIVVTASIGAVTARCTENVLAVELLEQADKALYEAKRAGRNRVSSTLLDSGPLQKER